MYEFRVEISCTYPKNRRSDWVIRVDNHPDAVVYPDVSCRESFRPGVMEKLQLCPDVLTKENPSLIYARLSGYGQEHNPLTYRAGHDINYISLSGALSKIGRVNEKPVPPINIVGDFGGGGLTCAFGIIAALYERSVNSSGKGQIIDCGITQGASYLSTLVISIQKHPTSLGKSSRKEWEEIFSNVDACVTPVLSIDEVSSNELTKNNFHISNSGESVPLPAPKLSRTPAQISTIEPLRIGEHSIEILRNTLGFTKGEIDNLISEEIIFE
ncbi:E5.1.99.4 [Lepeophtheirus salmonis]|uniref:E5.1.99.4 n=1 Tax=Lepeophtheirus salmonis TaxID=72036 RepID=A0A7R8H477_LEPSM|nr:E5.1.99.4 [Lepeophtheirus salmonis]CAF2843323.1 E5.1.99.4 [Lepeophtheirus salmonis]